MNDERDRRWRLLLGTAPEGTEGTLSRQDAAMDAALAALYDNQSGEVPGSVPRRRGWRDGSVTSAPIFRRGWCR